MARRGISIIAVGLALALCLTAAPAGAASFDFASVLNAPLYGGQSTFTVAGFLPGVDLKVTASNIEWTGQVGNSAYNILGPATMYYDNWRSANDFGLGINGIYSGTSAYEVGVTERLNISFVDSLTQAPTSVLLESINLALFFANESQGGASYDETGFFAFNEGNGAGAFTQLQAIQTISNPATDGLFTITANQVVSSLQLIGGLGEPAADERKSEFKVQSVSASPAEPGVPEPASLVLLASGLAGLAAFRRRRRRAGGKAW